MGSIGGNMFTLPNGKYLCIIDYHTKFPIFKKTEDLTVDSLILACKIMFSEYGLPRKIISDACGNLISDACGNFTSEKFEKLCRKLNIECAASSSYQHQNNGQVEICIKLVKCTLKKCCDTNSVIHLAL